MKQAAACCMTWAESILYYGSATWNLEKELQDFTHNSYASLLMGTQNISRKIYGRISLSSIVAVKTKQRFTRHCNQYSRPYLKAIFWRLTGNETCSSTVRLLTEICNVKLKIYHSQNEEEIIGEGWWNASRLRLSETKDEWTVSKSLKNPPPMTRRVS